MTQTEEMKQLLFTMRRIADAMESSSMVGQQYQVRPGRGGNSNGSTASSGRGEFDYDKSAIRKANEDLAKSVRRNVDWLNRWDNAIQKSTGAAESLRQTIDRLEDAADVSNDATRRVTSSMLKMVKQQKMHTDAVSEITGKSMDYSDALRKLITKQKERAQIEEAHKELADQIQKKNGELSRATSRNAKTKLKEELRELQARKAAMQTAQEFDAEIKEAAEHLFELGKTIAKDTNPAFQDLTSDVLKAADANKLASLSASELEEAHAELQPLVKAQANATRELIEQEQKQVQAMEKAREGIITSFQNMGKQANGIGRMILDNFRAQLKYNVKDSSYFDAATMGLSDAELSQFLGENAQMLRGMSGNGDNTALMDGRIQELQKQTTALYGVSGPEAMRLLADAGKQLQGAGINLKNAPNALASHLSNVSAMADRLGMVKSELITFQKELAESGDLAYMASKYESLGADAAAKALDQELEARIANAKMLGLGTAHIKQQIAIERANRYGSMEGQLRKLIAGRMDAKFAARSGVSVSPELQKIIEKQALGVKLSDDETKQFQQYQYESRAAHEQRINASGDDRSALMKLGAERQLSGLFGSDMYSEEGMRQQQAQEAYVKAHYSPEEFEEFKRTGKISEVAQKASSDAGDPNSFGEFMQMFNRAGTFREGYDKSPLGLIGKDVADILFHTRIISANSISNMLGIGGGGPGKGLLRGTGSRLANSGIGSMGRGIAGGLGMSGVANGASRMATLGRVALGGIATAGVGLLGAGAEYLGGSMKEDAIANGSRTNDTIFDKETGGAMLSTAGKAVSYAATGALIGSVIPGVGTAIGAAVGGVLGAGMGLYENADTLVSNINTVKDDLIGPQATLEKAKEEAEQQREAEKKPMEVVLTGPEAEAILKSGQNSDKLVDHTKEQVNETKKANEFKKSAADIRAMFDSKRASISATQQRFANIDT